MDIGASQQCVTFGCNVVLKNYFELLNNINFSKTIYCTYYWLIFSFFFLQKVLHAIYLKNNPKYVVLDKKVLGCKKYLQVLFRKYGARKSKYTLKPLLGQHMVHFTLNLDGVGPVENRPSIN